MKELVRLIVVLTVFSAAAGLLLAVTNAVTASRIAEARDAEKRMALADVLPEFDNDPNLATNVVRDGGAEWIFYAARKGGRYVGAAFESTSGRGYGGDIRVMVGVQADQTVRQIRILSHQETPGLGSKIADPAFKDQFKSRSAVGTKWAVKKDGGDIDAVTGATISSRAVTEAVRRGLEAYRAHAEAIARTGEPAGSGAP